MWFRYYFEDKFSFLVRNITEKELLELISIHGKVVKVERRDLQ